LSKRFFEERLNGLDSQKRTLEIERTIGSTEVAGELRVGQIHLRKVDSTWTANHDLFRSSDHFRNLELGTPKYKPKPWLIKFLKHKRRFHVRSQGVTSSKFQNFGV
jgi:hypothetical protein